MTLTVKQAAKRLHISPDTVRRLLKAGHLQGWRKTPARQSAIVIKEQSVAAYEQKNR